MTDRTPASQNTALLVSEIRKQQTLIITEGIKKAIHEAAVDLYKKLEVIDDWLRTDYTLAINLFENNDEWFAAQVHQKVDELFSELLSSDKEVASTSETVLSSVPPSETAEGARKFNLDQFSLVSKDEFEDWLTARTGVKYIETELGYELHEVITIYAALSQSKVDRKTCAIGPEKIFRALKSAVDEMEVPAAPQALFYKSVSRSLLGNLKELYGQVVALTHKHGVVYRQQEARTSDVSASSHRGPQGATATTDPFTDEVRSSEQNLAARKSAPHVPNFPGQSDDMMDRNASAVTAADVRDSLSNDDVLSPANGLGQFDSTPAENTGFSGYASAPVAAEKHVRGLEDVAAERRVGTGTLNTLSRMNATLSSGGQLSGAGAVEQPVVGTHYQPQELVGAISQLQQIHSDDNVIEKKKLKSWIQSGLGKIPGQTQLKIAQSESELIDVTDRFFEVIVEKIGVSGLLEKWLEKLKLTILKVVLRDKTFFSNAQHPARQMLNKLAKLAANEKTDKKRLEKVLDKFIDRVVEEYDRDEQAIEKVLVELDLLLERQLNAQKRNSDRIARAYEGKQKVASARHQVVKDIRNILDGKSVPVVLMELLDKAGWREHLALVAVREGYKSESYKEAINVVDLLLNWLGEEADESDKWALELEMELEAPSVIELVSKELSVVGVGGYEGIINRLEDCLFNDVDPLLVKVGSYEWPYDKTEKEIKDLSPEEAQDPSASHWHKRIVSMKVGDWVEIRDKDNRPRCLRLAWSGSESFRFVFVDSQGMKDEDLPLNDLVELFKQNKANFVDNEDVPLVDQGLHQMVQSVYEELASQSSCDVLTGLLNRQAIERGLEQCIAAAISNAGSASLIYIDVDKFNIVNTSYGHHAGDELLKHIAQIVKANCAEDAFCGRLGGNEFGLILQNSTLTDAENLATKICSEVAQQPLTWESYTINTSVSIGVSGFDVENDSSESVLRKAGLACELAKEQGRNKVVIHQEQSKDHLKRNEMLHWVQRLDEDLDELLTLRCQEIRPVNANGESRPHYEILLGVVENGQILPPGLLIEAAEHFGRMAKVDRWVIHNVLSWIEQNSSAVAATSGFSINLSGNSLSDDTFLEFIMGEFAASTVPPELICFEITETAAITNLADATEFIRVLKQTGCKFSLDDFGSGLSSYAYIQKLPVDYIKIDGIFIRNIANNEQDQALVKSINELAHFMGMKTVAEYVENHDILSVLRSIGVDHSQGFGIKKPGLLKDLA